VFEPPNQFVPLLQELSWYEKQADTVPLCNTLRQPCQPITIVVSYHFNHFNFDCWHKCILSISILFDG